MSPKQKIELRQSEIRARLGEVAALTGDALTEEIVTERDGLMVELRASEPQLQAAIEAEGRDSRLRPSGLDREARERIELRSRARVGNFLTAALRGALVSGAEAEIQAAAGVGGIPMELWEPDPRVEERSEREEHRAITPAPSTGMGVNLDPIRPAVFAPSIAPRLQIDMPMVGTGTYATGTITTNIAAGPVAKSAEVLQDAGAITTATATPKRVGASMALAIEDIAAIGAENFESILRQNISLSLSAELDNQIINGDGTGANLSGMFKVLTDASAPAAAVETWKRFLRIQSDGIDGLWATMLSHIAMVVGPETYRVAAATFQGNDSEESAASYLERMGDSFFTNSRMPVKASHIQLGILCRKGQTGMRTAVSPTWGDISVDDIYTQARKGERHFTVNALVGDVILVQPDAYKELKFRVSV